MQELTLFGGLAKAQTLQQIEVGVSKTSESVLPLIIKLSLSITSYRNVMLQPYPERKNGIIPVDDGDWRAIVLNVMVRRSFELWPKLTSSDIMRGLALTTQKAKSSVGGKLGMMNGRNIHQVDECWQVTNYKFHSKHINFSVEAKEAARRRARKWNIKNMN